MRLAILLLGVLQSLGPGPRVDRVSWLQGCWVRQDGDRTIEEQWLSPRPSSMLGVSLTTRGDTLLGYEMMLISERGEGLSYEAHPELGLPSVFVSTALGERRAIFENLKADFPERVGYELPEPGRLLTWAEGTRDGRRTRIDSEYNRVPCPGE